MKLQHLRVEQLRQFRQPVEITGFAPGINLFSGPNESGKSTLVRAIRAAFFERHRSSSVDDLQPWGDSSATPKVSLTFEYQGHRWQLHKSFLKQKRCDLQVDDASFSSDEAEEKLAELLGFQFPGRGASKAEHWGIPGLLWIEQGDGHNVRAAVEHAGDYLKSALGGSLGEIASNAGDEVMVEVERERAALLTGTGRPTGEYAKAIEQLNVLQSELRTLDDKIATYRQQVDRLGELRKQQTQDETERPWEIYRQQAQRVRDQLDEVNGWITQQQREEQELKNCRTQLDLVREQLARHQAQADELQTRAQQDEVARAEVNRQQERQPAIQANLQAARAAYEQARQAMQGARQNEQRQSVQRERQQLVGRLQDIDGHLIKARQLQLELHDLRAELQAYRIDPKSLKQLQKKQSELDTLRIRQQTIATRLHFELLPGQQLRLDDETISGQTERLLLSVAELEITGVGRIQIQPGGDEVADLARQQQRCQDTLSVDLQALSIASVAEAEQRARRYQTLEKEIEGKEALLAIIAPQGLDALQAEQQSADTRCRQLDEQLAAIPVSTEQVPSLASAEAQLEATERQLRNTEQEEGNSRQALALAERTAATTARELVRLRSELQSADRQQKAQQAQQQLIDLRADDERLHASIGKLQQQVDAARPDILRQDIARLDSTATGLEKSAAQRKLEIASLQASVQAQGAEGLEEQRAERELAFERAQQRRDQLVRRADALDLLRDLLRAEREALTRRLQAPLQRHLDRYLQLLFPKGRLSVDNHLIPHQLVRPAGQEQEVGDLDALSFGAREQMGLISRLAYADLLKDAGRPTLIILDDALVHSDVQRLEQMKRILFDAGQRHQILLFTCHPQNWRDLGVAARELRQEYGKIDL